MTTEEQANQTGEVFDEVPDVNADLEVQRQEELARRAQAGASGASGPTGATGPTQQQDLPEGVRRDEASGRRFIIEGGRTVWLDDKVEEGASGATGAPGATGAVATGATGAPINFNDPEQLKALIAGVVTGAQPPVQQQPQQPQVPLTPEQEDKLMNRWRPDDNWYKLFQDPETIKDAINQMRDGLIKEALTASKYMLDMSTEELQPVIKPLAEHVNQQKVKEWRNDFFAKYKVLEPYEGLLDMVVKAKTADGKWKPATRDKGFEEIAADVEKVLKTQNPNFSLSNPPPTNNGQQGSGNGQGQGGQQQQQNRTGQRMSTTTTGGGAGAGGGARTTQTADKKLDGGIWE